MTQKILQFNLTSVHLTFRIFSVVKTSFRNARPENLVSFFGRARNFFLRSQNLPHRIERFLAGNARTLVCARGFTAADCFCEGSLQKCVENPFENGVVFGWESVALWIIVSLWVLAGKSDG